MTLRHLKIFTAVYETESFTKAGNLLHLAQPSISLAIHQLEEMYHVLLFDRIKHGVYPTLHGIKLYEYATHILTLYDEMENSIKAEDILTTLRIGSSITIGNTILPILVQQFNKLYPSITIEVVIHNSISIEKLIMQNQIDFALIEHEPSLDKIISIPFMQDHLCTIAHPSHPFTDINNIPIQQIAQESFLMREEGSSVRILVDSVFLMHHIAMKPTWVSTSTHALIHAVEHKLGITTLPYQLVKERVHESKVTILDIPACRVQRYYNIVYYENKYLVKAALLFFEFCKTYAKDDMKDSLNSSFIGDN